MDPMEMSILMRKTGKFKSKLIYYKETSYYGFEVYFDKPVRVKKNSNYVIEAKLSGPPSCRGLSELHEVETSGVKFTFNDSLHFLPSNRTSISICQFPQLLFSF